MISSARKPKITHHVQSKNALQIHFDDICFQLSELINPTKIKIVFTFFQAQLVNVSSEKI